MAHRDVKPANIFLDGKGKYKLGDFGSACLIDLVGDIAADGTPDYLSPEMYKLLIGEKVEVDFFKSDIFSLGVTVLFLARLSLSSSISRTYSDEQQLKQAVEAETCGLTYSADLQKLLRRMLEKDPAKRPTIEQILFEQDIIDGREVNLAMMQHHLEPSSKRRNIIDVLLNWLRYLSSHVERESLKLQWQLAFA